ncbi:MAG: tetratricopeptide repeat protein [Chloroflexi bacterium]|nr:tetratricopeptide repeat protein [Chloroflexota bacterium]
MEYSVDEKARIKRLRTREAITLAMQNRWQEAVTANLAILEVFPTDVDAYNRLGRAYMELSDCAQAREAYAQALRLDPNNRIAQKNLGRLLHLKDESLCIRSKQHRVAPHLFIEETGRTGVASLFRLAGKEVLATVATGDQVNLRPQARRLLVETRQGDCLGEVEPKLGLRLIKLMEGGNHYTAAITSLDESGIKMMIREVYRHPSQAGILSFPLRQADGFRSYMKQSIIKHERGEEEESPEDSDYAQDWEEAEPMPEGIGFFEETVVDSGGEVEAEEEEED